jgi:hypothetical protein
MADLPRSVADLAEAVGADVVAKLLAAYGGRRVRIPGVLRAESWLVECVGSAAAEKIVAFYRVINADDRAQGVEVTLPIGEAGSIGRARRQAREAFGRAIEAGEGVRTAASRAGITERTGWNLKKRLSGGDDGQGQLF